MAKWPLCSQFENIICVNLLNNIKCFFVPLFLSIFCWLLKPSMWWEPEKQFCVLCDCNPVGSVTPWCDGTGRCACKSGFVGRQCHLSMQAQRQEERSQRAQRVLGPPQRWFVSSSSGCPRGAYRAPAPVIPEAVHGSCLRMLCSVCCSGLYPTALLPSRGCSVCQL